MYFNGGSKNTNIFQNFFKKLKIWIQNQFWNKFKSVLWHRLKIILTFLIFQKFQWFPSTLLDATQLGGAGAAFMTFPLVAPPRSCTICNEYKAQSDHLDHQD